MGLTTARAPGEMFRMPVRVISKPLAWKAGRERSDVARLVLTYVDDPNVRILFLVALKLSAISLNIVSLFIFLIAWKSVMSKCALLMRATEEGFSLGRCT